MVGERGFEPPAPASRRQCSTRLSYSPTGTRISCGSQGAGFLAVPMGIRNHQPSAAQHAEPFGLADELFARAAGASGGRLGLLDPAPVGVSRRLDVAAA
jgi:hypothetical protein